MHTKLQNFREKNLRKPQFQIYFGHLFERSLSPSLGRCLYVTIYFLYYWTFDL